MSHVAVTVTDLAVSVPWYERLLGAKPVLDEDTGGFHHTVYLLPGLRFWASTSIRQPTGTTASTSTGPAWTIFPSGSSTALSSRCGRPGSRSSGFPTGRSLMPTTARGCRSAIPTTSPWSSSRRPHRVNDSLAGDHRLGPSQVGVSCCLRGRAGAGRQSCVGGPRAGHHGTGRSPRAGPGPAAAPTGQCRALAGR